MWIALSVLGYLLVGMITARITYVLDIKDVGCGDSNDVYVMATIFWPVLLVFITAYFTGKGIGKIVTYPTKAQRKKIAYEKSENKYELLQKEIKRLEKELKI